MKINVRIRSLSFIGPKAILYPPPPREDYFLVVEIQERNCRTRLCVWEENTSFYKSHFSPSPPTVIFLIPSGLKAYFAPPQIGQIS